MRWKVFSYTLGLASMWLACAAALVLLAGAVPARGQDFQALVRQAQGSVVTILGFDVGIPTPKTQGSGFFVGEDVVATNHHVIVNAALIEVRTSMNAPPLRVLRVLESDPVADIALLEVDDTGSPLPLAERTPAPGEEIVVISSPVGLEKTVSRGVISGLREFRGRRVCQITASVSRGSSGGPILDARGEVLGMTSFTIAGEMTQNLNFGVLSSAIKELMDRGASGTNTRLRIGRGKHGEILITD